MAKKRSAAQKAADKRRTGRPPKADEEKRSEPVMVYLTKTEREELEAKAEAKGVTLATLIMSRWRDREE
jgi:hypothetical protein